MSAALQIHRIACPEDSEVRERLLTHLWKQFPMDEFRFQESADVSDPSYMGSRLCAIVGEEEVSQAPEVFLDVVEQAVSAFAGEEAEVAA